MMNDDLTIPQTSYAALPTGEYAAVLTSITRERSNYTDDAGRPKDQLVMNFELTGEGFTPDGEAIAGRTLRAWANPTFSSTGSKGPSKLFTWTAALLGRPIALGEAWHASAITGRPCVLSVVRVQEGDKTYSKVAAVLAAPNTEPAPPAAVAIGGGATATAVPLQLGAGA